MANLIILDGHSRTGKTYITSRLAALYPHSRLVRLQDKRPEHITDYSTYYDGCNDSALAFLRAAKPNDLYIMDRSLFSDAVFSKVFGRRTTVTVDILSELVQHHNIYFICLATSYSHYIATNKDAFKYTEDEWFDIMTGFAALFMQLEALHKINRPPTTLRLTTQLNTGADREKICDKLVEVLQQYDL